MEKYNEHYVQTQLIKENEERIKKLDATNKILQDSKDFFDLLNNDLEKSAGVMVPILREYIENIRSIRMAFANEVKDVIRSAAELNGIAKGTGELIKFCETVQILQRVLTPGFIDQISRLAKDDK